ncbi:MAG: hypothetical protein F2956_06750, partial [Actinobacteria bacterium]|nr:hypothetical protein [Actinomycetota bacterium]
MGLFKRTPKTPPVDPAEVVELRRQIDELRSQLNTFSSTEAEASRRLQEVDGKIISLNARVTQVGSEVTHQLSELSGDIDTLGQRTTEIAVTVTELPQQIEALHTDQSRLAA